MRLGRIGVGALMAAAAFAMPAAPAQAQSEFCFQETGTKLDGKCVPITDENGNPCVGRYCVTGLQENIDALVRLIWEKVPDVDPDDWLPVCTPNLFSGPICVG